MPDDRRRLPVLRPIIQAAIATMACSAIALGAAPATEKPVAKTPKPTTAKVGNPYTAMSDEQMSVLAGTFEDLDHDERRWFLTEVRKRMAAKGERPRIPVAERGRFGRVVRNVGNADANGNSEETSNTAADPADETDPGTKVYGTGYERSVEPERDATTGQSLRAEDPPSRPAE